MTYRSALIFSLALAGCQTADAPKVALKPVIVDTAPLHCPEPSANAQAEAKSWVQRLKPDQNTIGDVKAKLVEYQLSQVRKQAVISELLADLGSCRNGAASTKALTQ